MSKESDPSRTQLFVGILSFVGVILGILATIFAPVIQDRIRAAREPTQMLEVTAAPPTETYTPAPTDTVPPGQPTSTPAPTDTPAPTATPTATAIPPVPIGQDWSAGCISTLWKPYPSNVPTIPRDDGCWQEPLHVFSAENGDLDFLAERASGGNEFYGLFAPLPESGSVSFYVKLEELDNIDLLMGIYAEPDIVNAQGLLMIIPHERLNKLRIVQKDNVISYNTLQGTGTLDQNNGFSITFTFTLNSASSTVNPSVFVTNPVSIASSQKWLFLGYKGLSGSYRLEGRFFRLELK